MDANPAAGTGLSPGYTRESGTSNFCCRIEYCELRSGPGLSIVTAVSIQMPNIFSGLIPLP